MTGERIHVFYRLANQPAAQAKTKLAGATKEACLQNCVAVFGAAQCLVFGDRIDDATCRIVNDCGVRLVPVDEGSGGGNFRRAAEAAMALPDDAIVYLLEDDFLHLPAAPAALIDGLRLGAKYVTLYDHPDKYVDPKRGGNPHVSRGGERTRLMCGTVSHWKITNSTVMTFATTAGQLKKDWHVFLRYCGGRYTDDYRLFRALSWRGRRLFSSVPGLATHCETVGLSPLVEWRAVAKLNSGCHSAMAGSECLT